MIFFVPPKKVVAEKMGAFFKSFHRARLITMSVPTGGVAMMASLSGGVVRAQPRRSKAASARSAATQSAASVASCPRPSTSSHRACLVKNNNNDILRLVKSNNNTLRTPATRARIVTTSVSATPATTTSSSPGDDAAAASADTAAAPPAPEAAKGKKRPFIPALDSTRFFLISYIAVGHFIACCTKDAFTLRLLSQVNVVVGAFFVLSVGLYTLNPVETHSLKQPLSCEARHWFQSSFAFNSTCTATSRATSWRTRARSWGSTKRRRASPPRRSSS
jgi:hypothetical protein